MANLVLGYGFLGQALCRILGDAAVTTVRRTPARSGAIAVDLLAAHGVALLGRALPRFEGDVYFMLPPSAIGDRPPRALLQPLLEQLANYDVRRLVLVSSSGVYGDSEQAVVDAASRTPALGSRVERLLAIEQVFAECSGDVRIVRLAGLYGDGRVIGRRPLAGQQPLPGDPEAWLNLIHVRDAARGLMMAAQLATAPKILLLSDGVPIRRSAYYAMVAREFTLPEPRFDASAARRGGSRQIDPRASWAGLHLTPRETDIGRSLRDIHLRERESE